MKKILLLLAFAMTLSSCDWTVNPQPFPVWTPIPSRTPGIVSPTPIILIPTGTASVTAAPGTDTPSGPTETPTGTFTASPTVTTTPFQEIQVLIIGCNTGIDISHGMGEVTNAYITLKNTGTLDLPNACGLLRAADENREHPDKSKCVDNLPAGYQVTLELTVDSTYNQQTVIQVDASSNGQLLVRLDTPACTDLDVIGPIPGDLGVIKTISP
jgi:hypothetical protein